MFETLKSGLKKTDDKLFHLVWGHPTKNSRGKQKWVYPTRKDRKEMVRANVTMLLLKSVFRHKK